MRRNPEYINNNIYLIDSFVAKYDINHNDFKHIDIKHFIHAFDNVNDFRKRINRCIWSASQVLMMIIYAKLVGKCVSCTEIANFCEAAKYKLYDLKIIDSPRTPTHDLFYKFINFWDGTTLQEMVSLSIDKLLQRLSRKYIKKSSHYKYDLTQADGKSINGTGRKGKHGNNYNFGVYNSSNATLDYNVSISTKDSEIPTFQGILPLIDIKSSIITADALHTQIKTCELINNGKGYYVLPVKDNQPSLKEEISERFIRTSKKVTVIEKEKRTFSYIKVNQSTGCEWPGQKAYIKMISKTRNKEGVEMFFITSLNKIEAAIEAIENRWDIEGELHHPRDTILFEDKFIYGKA